MEQQIRPFLFEGEVMVRTIERDGGPWFIASDVCRSIGLTNTSQAVSILDDDEKSNIILNEGGRPRIIISESGLYSLILRSDAAVKPGTTAHRFRKWVTSEVLPTLHQQGSYTVEKPGAPPHPQAPKPFDEWSLDEIRTHLSVANGYRHTLNTASAGWYLMRAGFPRPPERLLPAFWQSDLDLRTSSQGGRSVTIIVPQGGDTH